MKVGGRTLLSSQSRVRALILHTQILRNSLFTFALQLSLTPPPRGAERTGRGKIVTTVGPYYVRVLVNAWK